MQRRLHKNFENSKNQCLGKRDKSFAGRIDVHAVEICSVINERDYLYTTSSCSGRCFLYQGHGVKKHDADNVFERCRISHELVEDAKRYFDLQTLEQDRTGGADPISPIGQFEHKEQVRQLQQGEDNEEVQVNSEETQHQQQRQRTDQSVWLRFEPFILHVCCRSLLAANCIMNAARPTFKNVGLTTWKESKYLVAIWGDEGLDMPLSLPNGQVLYQGNEEWLAQLVNERHERNWTKIYKFVEAVRAMPFTIDGDEGVDESDNITIPSSFDVIGDIALLHNMPDGNDEERRAVGQAIMKKNKAIKLCVARTSNLEGTERAPGNMTIIAGMDRSTLITTHTEYGTQCVVDLERTFFSPRMGPERIRICQQVARGEDVLVLFAGVGMEALQIASRTEARSVVAVELNPVAVECARRGHRRLQRSKSIKCVGAAERLQILEGDVLDVLPKMESESFDRVLAPRPKEGALDGDLGSGDFGAPFLDALLPLLKSGGELHWYDFAADHEFPACDRTRKAVRDACDRHGRSMKVIHVANAGSVAMRQLRICMDVKVFTEGRETS